MYYEDSLEPGPTEKTASAAEGGRPPHVPEKFWDPATGAIRTDSLLRAYLDLEKRMHTMISVPGENSPAEELAAFRRALGVPEGPDGYRIELHHEMLENDADINTRLFEAGFTPSQAQLVYDLAAERVVPMFEEMKREFEEQRGLDRLKEHFGGDARWNETARQITAWGKANLSPEIYAALSASPDGIVAMRRMMGPGEPAMGNGSASADEPMSEADLKRMMADPRYWKKRDPAWINKVQDGFKRLYGDE